MAYGYRRYTRGYFRRSYARSQRRNFRYRRLYSGRRYRRRPYRRNSTKSAIVKLSLEGIWTPFTGTTSLTVLPFRFQASLFPGFTDYDGVYSHFRILKGVLKMHAPQTDHFLIAPSRPFAATTGPFSSNATQTATQLVPSQTENSLRQTKWQREVYPSTNRTYIRVGFKPYTMVGTTGPTTGSGAPIDYYRVWEGKRWMPMSWAIPTAGTTTEQTHFWGPYICPNTQGNTDESVEKPFSLTIYVQFRGQR